MSVNITFTGNIFNSSNIQYSSDEVIYQLYFYKVNSNSSSSIWSNTRLSELGQYNINLGDNDIVTPEGVVNSGDKVVIAFWTPNTSNLTDNDLTEWSYINITLTSDTEYITDVQLKGAQTPNCSFSVTGATTINNDVYVNDIGSNDTHSWSFSGSTMYQTPSIYGQQVFYAMNTLPTSSIDIYWDDTEWSYNQNPSTSYTHQYTSANSYDIVTYVTNTSGLSASQTINWLIYNNVPVVDFTIDNTTPEPIGITGVGEEVTFTNITTDPDGLAVSDGWTCDWIIEDGEYTTIYTGKSLTFEPSHQFHSSGSHDISLVLHWYNGDEWVQSTKTKSINQQVWSVSNGLTWVQPVYVNVPVLFSPSVSGDTQYISSISYYVDNSLILSGLTQYDTFNYTFHVSSTHTVTQVIYYNDGFGVTTQTEHFTILMSPIADFIQSDDVCGDLYTSTSIPGNGIITLYKWKVYLNDVEVASLEGPTKNIFEYNWPTIGEFKVLHTIVDSDGNITSKLTTYNVNSCKHEIVYPTSNQTGGFPMVEIAPVINCSFNSQFSGSDLINIQASLNSVKSVPS